jgi:hypothetical protein
MRIKLAAIAAVLLVAAASTPTGTTAAAVYCGPSDSYLAEMLAFAQQQATGAGAAFDAWRASRHFPAASAASVQPVATESVCQRIGSVIYSGVDSTWRHFPIYVVAIGAGGYLVSEPHARIGEWGIYWVVDSSMTTVLSSFSK